MAEYGIPYMGSKSKICNEIVRLFPKADNFYDLFGGGFSVTHAVLLRRSRDFKAFHFNEIRPGICDLIKKAIAGDFNYERFKPPFVSSEEFKAKFETDPYIKMIWSFGNNGMDYSFSKEIEPYKRSMHNAIVFNDFDELAEKTTGMKAFKDDYSINQRRLFLRNRIEFYRVTGLPRFLYPFVDEEKIKKAEQLKELQQLQQLEQLERLQPLQPLQRLEQLERLQQLERLEQLQRLEQLEQLERLQQLQRLQRLQRLEFYSQSYDRVPIKDDSVIYCDPPYQNTCGYDDNKSFDHESFLDWCDKQKGPVFISEYEINDKRFCPIFKIEKRSLLSSASRETKLEKIYVNRAGRIRLNGKA